MQVQALSAQDGIAISYLRLAAGFDQQAMQLTAQTSQLAAQAAEIDTLKSQLDTVTKERDALKSLAAAEPEAPKAS